MLEKKSIKQKCDQNQLRNANFIAWDAINIKKNENHIKRIEIDRLLFGVCMAEIY